MQALLIAATSFEIQPAIEVLNKRTAGNWNFVPIVTGVGVMSATYKITTAIDLHSPSLVIQAGIGGSVDADMIGEVVAITDDSIIDLGVWEEENFRTVFDMGFAELNESPYTNGILSNPSSLLVNLLSLPKRSGITVNEITTSEKRLAQIRKRYPSAIESMEGAALHFVCLMKRLPFIQLRAVSNELGVRDKNKWQIKSAIQKLNEQLIVLLNKLEDYNEDDLRF